MVVDLLAMSNVNFATCFLFADLSTAAPVLPGTLRTSTSRKRVVRATRSAEMRIAAEVYRYLTVRPAEHLCLTTRQNIAHVDSSPAQTQVSN